MTQHVTASDGLRIAYDERGEGPPVVFVHGLGLSRRRWGKQVRAVVEAGFRAIRFDLRGFGESDAPHGPYGMDDLVGDLETVVGACGVEDLHLVGHSLGGMISLAFAVRQPERLRSLALASTTSHNGRRASRFARGMATISELGFDRAIEDTEVRETVGEILAQAFPEGVRPALDHFRRGLEDPNPAHAHAWRVCDGFSVVDHLDRIACPVLVLHGTADPLMPFVFGRWIHEAMPGSRFVPLEGAGHSVQVERPRELNEALVEHLLGSEGGRSGPSP